MYCVRSRERRAGRRPARGPRAAGIPTPGSLPCSPSRPSHPPPWRGPRPAPPHRPGLVIMWPLLLVHLALFAIPFLPFSAWDVLIFVVTRITGLGRDGRVPPVLLPPLVQDHAVVPVPARRRRVYGPPEGAAVVGHPPPPPPPPLGHPGRPALAGRGRVLVRAHGVAVRPRPHAPGRAGRSRPDAVPGAGLAGPALDDPRPAPGGGLLRGRRVGRAGVRVLPERGGGASR